MSNTRKKQNIVTIGGGTGSFTLLTGLKKYPVELAAVVGMADDGGSTGVLRDELGVLPPGDVRQCLVALSGSGPTLRELFNYRYAGGGLSGHSFGNIFLSTLEKITGCFDEAVREAGRILGISGEVIPVTMTNTNLVAEMASGKKIIGEHNISNTDLSNLKRMKLKPRAVINPEAAKAIFQADKIVINPGNLFSSIIPNFLVTGVPEAIQKSRARKIYVCNLMTRIGHTHGFTVVDHVNTIERYLGSGVIQHVIYNKENPEQSLTRKYAGEGKIVEIGDIQSRPDISFSGYNLLSKKIYQKPKGDRLKRTLIRHDNAKIAKIIFHL